MLIVRIGTRQSLTEACMATLQCGLKASKALSCTVMIDSCSLYM